MRTLANVFFSCWIALIVFGCAKTKPPVRTSHAPVVPAINPEKSVGVVRSRDVYLQFNPARSNTIAQNTDSQAGSDGHLMRAE